MLSWHAIDCPTCPAKAGQKCRTLNTNRVTDTHVLRVDRWEEQRRRKMDERREELRRRQAD